MTGGGGNLSHTHAQTEQQYFHQSQLTKALNSGSLDENEIDLILNFVFDFPINMYLYVMVLINTHHIGRLCFASAFTSFSLFYIQISRIWPLTPVL